MRRVVQWCSTHVARGRARLGLSSTGLALLAAALVAAAAAAVGLAGVSEDVLARNGLERADPSNLRLFTAHRPPALVGAARAVTALGGVGVLLAVGLIAAVMLWRRGARLATAVAPVVSLLLAAGFASAAKQLVGRARPPAGLRLVGETEPSFPSGHATDSAALYLALGLVLAIVVFRRPLARAAVVAVAGLVVAAVGASRLVLGVHWPTDVLAGWMLGSLVALGLTVVTTLLPAVPAASAPTGGGVTARSLRLLALDRGSRRPPAR